MRINPVLTRLGDYPIAAVHEKVAELRSQGTHVIDFSIGDPREPTPPFIRQALIDAVPVSSQYPLTAGIAELRQAVADYVRRRFDVDVDPDTQVMPTSGSKEAVFSAPLAFVDPEGADIVAYRTPATPSTSAVRCSPAPTSTRSSYTTTSCSVPPPSPTTSGDGRRSCGRAPRTTRPEPSPTPPP